MKPEPGGPATASEIQVAVAAGDSKLEREAEAVLGDTMSLRASAKPDRYSGMIAHWPGSGGSRNGVTNDPADFTCRPWPRRQAMEPCICAGGSVRVTDSR